MILSLLWRTFRDRMSLERRDTRHRGDGMYENESNPCAIQWAVLPGGAYQACGRTVSRLPAGAYACSLDYNGRPEFHAKQLLADDLVDFPGSLPAKVLQEIEKFWKLGERFRQHGFLHRRG